MEGTYLQCSRPLVDNGSQPHLQHQGANADRGDKQGARSGVRAREAHDKGKQLSLAQQNALPPAHINRSKSALRNGAKELGCECTHHTSTVGADILRGG